MANKVVQQIMERTKDSWRSVSTRPCESPDVVIVSLRATHRVAPTTLDVKGIVSAIFTTPGPPGQQARADIQKAACWLALNSAEW